MFLIFIHLSGLALLEILFYFLYVGPMETKTFKETINKSIRPEDELPFFYIQNSYNNEQLIEIENNITQAYLQDVNNGERNRDNFNNNLFIFAMKGWSVIISTTIVVIICEFFYKYFKYKTNLRSFPSVTNITIEMINDASYNYDQTATSDTQQVTEEPLVKVDKRKLLKQTFHFVFLLSLILGFEFWFFNNIVMKYKIISKEELEYLLIQQFAPLINNGQSEST